MDNANNTGYYNADDLRAFLLGHLPERDAELIEGRMIADETFFREIQIVEDEIIDEYALGTLPEAEEIYFIQRSEKQPGLSQRIAIRKAFFAALTKQSKHPVKESSKPSSRQFRWFLVPALALASVVLVVMCGVLLHGRQGMEKQLAQAERKQESSGVPAIPSSRQFQAAIPPLSRVGRMFLPAHVARGAGGEAPLRLSASPSRLVEFELETPADTSRVQRWSVSIANEQNTLILQTGLHMQQTGSVSFVRAYVDPSTLSPGNYSVLLSDEKSPQSDHSMRWRLSITK